MERFFDTIEIFGSGVWEDDKSVYQMISCTGKINNFNRCGENFYFYCNPRGRKKIFCCILQSRTYSEFSLRLVPKAYIVEHSNPYTLAPYSSTLCYTIAFDKDNVLRYAQDFHPANRKHNTVLA
jgi:hypothetical protein